MRRLLPALALLSGCAHSHRPLPPPVVQSQPAAPVKSWRDQAEYDLANAALREADPEAKLADLDKWAADYPATEYIDERQDMYLSAYQSFNQGRQVFDKAQEILRARPNDFRAVTQTVFQVMLIKPAPTAADLDTAEKAANLLLDDPDTVYNAANKPRNLTDAEWMQAKNQIGPFTEQVLLQIYVLRKDDKRAVNDLTKLIQRDPTLAAASFQLGKAMLNVFKAERRPQGQPSAFYQIARSVAYDGPGGLPANQKAQVRTFLTGVYTAFHGSADGLDQLLATARSGPFPPPNFSIQSTADIIR